MGRGPKKTYLHRFEIVFTEASESKQSIEKKTGEYFNTLNPLEPRTGKAAASRFADLESSYKFA